MTASGRVVETDLQDKIERLWTEGVLERQYNFLLEVDREESPEQWSKKYEQYL